MGIPTDRFDRNVASKESNASFAASSRLLASPSARSRIGLPYLVSPICRNTERVDASTKLPAE